MWGRVHRPAKVCLVRSRPSPAAREYKHNWADRTVLVDGGNSGHGGADYCITVCSPLISDLPATPLLSYITHMYLLFSKFTHISINLPTNFI